MRKQHGAKKRAVAYVVDPEPGLHRYAFVEGVGECRENFKRLVDDLDRGKIDAVVAAAARYLYIDTSAMWIEKLIASVKRHRVLIVDAASGKEYDVRTADDEAAFRALGKSQPA